MKFVLIVALIASIGAQVGADYQGDYPVCASDGYSYYSQSEFNYSLEEDSTLTVKFYGTCENSIWDDHICQEKGTSWKCGSDGDSYKNECYFDLAAKRNSGLIKRHDGKCKSFDHLNTVCGTDRKYYSVEKFLAEQSVRPELNDWPFEYCRTSTPSNPGSHNGHGVPPREPIPEIITICGNDELIYFFSTFLEQQKIRPELEELPLSDCYYKPYFQF